MEVEPGLRSTPSKSLSLPQLAAVLKVPDDIPSRLVEEADLEMDPTPEALALRTAFVAYCRGHDWRPGAPPGTLPASSSPLQAPTSTSGGLHGSPSTSSLAVASPIPPPEPGNTGYGMGLNHWMRLWTDLGLAEAQGGPVAGAVLQTVHAAYRPHNSSRLSYLGFAQACVALSGQLRYDLLRPVGRHGAALLAQQRYCWRLHQLQQLQAHGTRSSRPLRSSLAGDEDMPDGNLDLMPQDLAKEAAVLLELKEVLQQQQQQQQQQVQGSALSRAGWTPRDPPPPPPLPQLPDPPPAPRKAASPQVSGGGGGSSSGGGCGSQLQAAAAVSAGADVVAAPKSGGRIPLRPQKLQLQLQQQPQPQQKQAGSWVRSSADTLASPNPYLQALPRSKHYSPHPKPLRLALPGETSDLRACADGLPDLRDPWAGRDAIAAVDDPDASSSPLNGQASRGRGPRGPDADLAFPMSSGLGGAGPGAIRSPGSGLGTRAGDAGAVKLPAVLGASRLAPDAIEDNAGGMPGPGTTASALETRNSGGVGGGAASHLAAGSSRRDILLASLSGIGGSAAAAAAAVAEVGGGAYGFSDSSSSASLASAVLGRVERLERSSVTHEGRMAQVGSRLKALEAAVEAEIRQEKRARSELSAALVQHFEARQAALEQRMQAQQQQLVAAMQAADAARAEAATARAEAAAAKAAAVKAAEQARAAEDAVRAQAETLKEADASAVLLPAPLSLAPPAAAAAVAVMPPAIAVAPSSEELAAAADAAVTAASERMLGSVRAQLDEQLRTVAHQQRKLDGQFEALFDQQQQLLAEATRATADATAAAAAAASQLAAFQEAQRSGSISGCNGGGVTADAEGSRTGGSDGVHPSASGGNSDGNRSSKGGGDDATDSDLIAALALDLALLREELRSALQAGSLAKGAPADDAVAGLAVCGAIDGELLGGGDAVATVTEEDATTVAPAGVATTTVPAGCPDAAALRVLVEQLQSEVVELRTGKNASGWQTEGGTEVVSDKAPEPTGGVASDGCRPCGCSSRVSAEELQAATERWQAALAAQREELEGQLTRVAREVAAATNAAAAAMAAAAAVTATVEGKGPVPDLTVAKGEPVLTAGGLEETVSELQARVLELETEISKAVKQAKSAHAAACTAAAVAASGGTEVALQLGDAIEVKPVRQLCSSMSELEGKVSGLGERLTTLEIMAGTDTVPPPRSAVVYDTSDPNGSQPSAGASKVILARLEALEAEVARATSALAAAAAAAAAATAATAREPQQGPPSSAIGAVGQADVAAPDATAAEPCSATHNCSGGSELQLAVLVARLEDRLDELQRRLDELGREQAAAAAKAVAKVEEPPRRLSSPGTPLMPRPGAAAVAAAAQLTPRRSSAGADGVSADHAAGTDEDGTVVTSQQAEVLTESLPLLDASSESAGVAQADTQLLLAEETDRSLLLPAAAPPNNDSASGGGSDIRAADTGDVEDLPTASSRDEELAAALGDVRLRLAALEAVAGTIAAAAAVGEAAAAAAPPPPPPPPQGVPEEVQRRLDNLATEVRQSLDLMSSSIYRDIEHARTDVAVMLATEVRQQVEAALAASQPKRPAEPAASVTQPAATGTEPSSGSSGGTTGLVRALQERLTSTEKELAEVTQEITDVCRAADMTTESVELLTKHLQALDEGQRDIQRQLAELQQRTAAMADTATAVHEADAATANSDVPAPKGPGSETGASLESRDEDVEANVVIPPARPNTQAHGARDPDLLSALAEISSQLAEIQAQNLRERIEAAERALLKAPPGDQPDTASAPPAQPPAIPQELQSLLLELSGQVDSVVRVVREQEHGLDVLAQVAEAATSTSRNAAARLDVVEASLAIVTAAIHGTEGPTVHPSILRSRAGTTTSAVGADGLGVPPPSGDAEAGFNTSPSRHVSQQVSRHVVTFGAEALLEETRESVSEVEGRLAEVEKGLQVRGAAMAALSQQLDETVRRLEALDARLSDVAMDAAAAATTAAATVGGRGGSAAGGKKTSKDLGGGAAEEYEESPDSYGALDVDAGDGGGGGGATGVAGDGLSKLEQEWQARLKAAMKVLQDKMQADRDVAQAETGELRKGVARLKEKSVLIDEVILKLARRLDNLSQRVHDMLDAEAAETMTTYSAIDRDRLRAGPSRSMARSDSGESNYQDGVYTPAGSLPPSRMVSRSNSALLGR